MTRQKIPIGGGSFFVLTKTTLRIPLTSFRGEVVSEMLLAAAGAGTIILVPPGAKLRPGVTPCRLSPIEALELLRRTQLHNLTLGGPQIEIPSILVRRAKADTKPGIEALVAFPGEPRKFFEGRGSWEGCGLWVSGGGEYLLEIPGVHGYLRNVLGKKDAESWLTLNGHELRDVREFVRQEKDVAAIMHVWKIATKGHEGAGSGHHWVIKWDETGDGTKSESRLSEEQAEQLKKRIAKLPPLSAPQVSPPGKPRRPKRRR